MPLLLFDYFLCENSKISLARLIRFSQSNTLTFMQRNMPEFRMLSTRATFLFEKSFAIDISGVVFITASFLCIVVRFPLELIHLSSFVGAKQESSSMMDLC